MTNNQRKETLSEVLNRISKDDFIEKYLELSRDEIREYFQIGHQNLKNFIKHHHLEYLVEESKQIKRKKYFKDKSIENKYILLAKAPKDLFIKYYLIDNHTIEETLEHFSISMSECIKLINEYDAHKDAKLSAINTLATKEAKYGDSGYNNRDKARATCIEKYGVENPSQVLEFTQLAYASKLFNRPNDPTNITKNFETRIINHGSIENSYMIATEHRIESNLEKYGVSCTSKLPEKRKKISESLKATFMEKYGSTCYWTTEDAKRSNGSRDSNFNLAFSKLLDENNITYEREFTLNNFIYDFKIGKNLIEINPTPTHNITWSPYSDNGIDRLYHQRKSKNAEDNDFRCIHIWDWDDIDKIIYLLKSKTSIYARKCEIKLVNKAEAAAFLNTYHLQNYAKDEIRIGLYYDNLLVSIMTFGKPRYNKKYQYELIRYCSSYNIIGGAEKLFKYFISNYSPESIISYCDRSKFNGNVYMKLGFKFNNITPSSHWFNLKTRKHILDSLLRARGFDQLLGKEYGEYGKGTDNHELMIKHGFAEIVDAGQASYIYKTPTK